MQDNDIDIKDINLFLPLPSSKIASLKDLKTCVECGRELPYSDFGFLVKKQKHSSWCKRCTTTLKTTAINNNNEDNGSLQKLEEMIRELQAQIRELQIDNEILKARTIPTPDVSTRLPTSLEDLPDRLEAISKKLVSLDNRIEIIEQPQVYDAIVNPGETRRERGELLIALIQQNGGKLDLKEARRKMNLSSDLMSKLLLSMGDKILIIESKLDRRNKVLVLKNKTL